MVIDSIERIYGYLSIYRYSSTMHLDNSKAIKFYVLWLFLSEKDIQEQSAYTAQGLVMTASEGVNKAFSSTVSGLRSSQYQPVPVYYWELPLSQPLKESMCTLLCRFPGHSDPTLPAVLNSANRFPIQVTMDCIHSRNFSQCGKFWPRTNDKQQEKQQHCYDTSHLLSKYESNLKRC